MVLNCYEPYSCVLNLLSSITQTSSAKEKHNLIYLNRNANNVLTGAQPLNPNPNPAQPTATIWDSLRAQTGKFNGPANIIAFRLPGFLL